MRKISLNIEVGQRLQNNQGSWFTVLEVNGKSKIKFDSGCIREALNVDILRGQVKDLLFPQVCGVGCIGEGNFKQSLSVSGKITTTREYGFWIRMMSRCYSPDPKGIRKHYKGVTVHPDWHNFQNFAKWCNEQKGFKVLDFVLDKDILVKGNKEYGPDACCFVPRYLNSVFVCYNKKKKHYFRNNTYEVSFGKKHIGRTKNFTEADFMYNEYFGQLVREIVEQHKDLLDEKLYFHLSNFKGD